MSLFITQCPHCHTAFKTSISQLQSADGMVRCGACLRVFTADDNLLPSADLRTITRPVPETDEEEDNTAEHEDELKQLTMSALDSFDNATTDSQGNAEPEEQIHTLDLADSLPNRISPSIPAASTFWQIIDEETLEPVQSQPVVTETASAEEDAEEIFAQDVAVPSIALDTPSLDAPTAQEEDTAVEETAIDEPAIPFPQTPTVEIVEEAAAPAPFVAQKNEDDSLTRERMHATRFDDELLNENSKVPPLTRLSEDEFAHVSSSDAPLELRWQEQTDSGHRQGLFTALAFLLVLVLGAQALWFNRANLSQSPAWRPLVEQVCVLARCELEPIIDIKAIHSDALQVRSHPDIANALSVHFVFRNDAAFAKPFPGMYLRFSDTNGQTVVQRSFTPAQYLPEGVASLGMMPPNAPVQIALEILDPGPEAVNYELGFYAIER